MRVEAFGATDIGLCRLNNEDVYALLLKEKSFLLADGMGGHNAGEVAASETVLFLSSEIKKNLTSLTTSEAWHDFIIDAIQQANEHLYILAKEDPSLSGMGTTLCFAHFLNHSLIYAHVGDSRIYRIRKGRLTQLTRDHSLCDDLIEKGELDECLALTFPYKNVITRAVGTQKKVIPDVAVEPTEPGDLYFLCSDGLTDSLSDAQIHDLIDEASSLKEAVDSLIVEAKKSGGNDNITIVMVKVEK